MTENPKILVVGYSHLTWEVVRALDDSGCPAVGLITLPTDSRFKFTDRADFSHFKTQIEPVEKLSAPILQKFDFDTLFVMGWSQMIGRDLLALPQRGTFGSHPSLLPRNRGRAAIPWTILNGDRRSALSLFRLADEVDAGPIYVQEAFELSPRETATTLYEKLRLAARVAIPKLLHQIRSGDFSEVKTTEGETYNYIRHPEDGEIDWTASAETIDRLIRATTRPYPGAFTRIGFEKVVLWNSELGRAPHANYSALPGQILDRVGNRLLVHTGAGVLEVTEFETNGALAVGKRFS